jgi:YegS/Rv2252/BmrU family lipid kinase
MPAKVILNPYAGRWMALRRKEEIEAALQAAGIEYDLAVTEGPGHGQRLAQEAVQAGYSPLISAGGDGSISEVINGLIAAGEGHTPPLGLLPLGSANDMVANLSQPVDLAAAARAIAAGCLRSIDLCEVSWSDGSRQGRRFFANNSAIGLEPFITTIQQRIQRLRGNLRYIVATLRGVMANPKWTMSLEWEGGSYHGPATLVTVGNGARTGGVFYVTPHADMADGLLTFVYGYLSTRGEILRVLPQTTKPGAGNYVEHPAIHEQHTPWLSIHTTPTPLHADGEIQSLSAVTIDYRILPERLQVIVAE